MSPDQSRLEDALMYVYDHATNQKRRKPCTPGHDSASKRTSLSITTHCPFPSYALTVALGGNYCKQDHHSTNSPVLSGNLALTISNISSALLASPTSSPPKPDITLRGIQRERSIHSTRQFMPHHHGLRVT